MQLFKINIKELIFIIIFSVPIGGFLYINNANKITIEHSFPRGYGYVQNLCNSIPEIFRAEILSDGDIISLVNNYNTNALNMTLEASKSNNLYKIKLKSNGDQLNSMRLKITEIKNDLNSLEGNSFKKLLGDISIHCGGITSFKIYKYIPLNEGANKESIISRYTIGHLLFLSISPFIILYLLLISKKYIYGNLLVNKKVSN